MAECNYRHIALIPAYMPINEITKFGRHSDIIYERTK